jgi:hypothetical protein
MSYQTNRSAAGIQSRLPLRGHRRQGAGEPGLLLDDPAIVSFSDRSTLSHALSLFDRIVWLVNQIAQGLS